MSALDKAFLRAYTKQTPASAPPADTPVAGLPPGAYLEDAPGESPMLVTQPYTDHVYHRFDAPHATGEPLWGRLDADGAMSPDYGDLAIIGPYQDPGIEALLSDTAPPQETLPEAPPEARPEARSEPARPAVPLKLPSVFQPPDEFDDAHAFSPDWEVDRFLWPEICEQLLEVEHRYFRHVGERLKAATEDAHHVVMVSGCRRGEGRTTLALCLARCAAMAGAEVAVVDADWQNPQVGTRLGMETPCGWTEVLTGKAPLNEAAVASVEDRLTLFPLKPSGETTVEAGDRRLSRILSKIAAHYPLVIVDAGPLGAEDQPPFAGEDNCPVDAAIVVRDLRYTTEKKALATAQRLQQSGIAAVGIAENFEAR